MLEGKHIVLGVTGSIAAYKIASLASMLAKKHADVTVIMTRNATNFINPITFESLTGNKCLVDTFDRNFEFQVEHVSLAKQTDVFLTAPASANVIAKAAHGIADDMLTTTLLACTCPKIFAPAMNTRMYQNPVVQDNMEILKRYGMEVITPADGYLACGDTGAGKMPEPEVLYEAIVKALTPKDMAGKRVLVTAGPTREKIDPVRYISNHSTGKMGYAIARAAMLRGADVTLVSGKVNLEPPKGVRLLPVVSAADMAQAVTAGPTREKIDPVRYISNHSTGKMGYAIARAAMLRGADVTLVSGKVNLEPPKGVRLLPVVSAADMAQAVKENARDQDIIIKAAAVADYRPSVTADEKLKKKDGEMTIELERTEDILAYLGAHRRNGQFLCGFSMETEHMLGNSRLKLEKKNIDMIVANNLKQAGAGFGTDTNVVTFLTADETVQLPIMSKEDVADRLLSFIMERQ